jgi:hypothetical protein
MTSGTYCRTTTADQGHSFSVSSQSHSNACNENQPPNSNEKNHRYARKSTCKNRLRTVKVAQLVKDIDGNQEETLG